MEAVRQCQVAMLVSERVREDHLHSRLFSIGSIIILYFVAPINAPQQSSDLAEASVEVAAADEGVRARGRVESPR